MHSYYPPDRDPRQFFKLRQSISRVNRESRQLVLKSMIQLTIRGLSSKRSVILIDPKEDMLALELSGQTLVKLANEFGRSTIGTITLSAYQNRLNLQLSAHKLRVKYEPGQKLPTCPLVWAKLYVAPSGQGTSGWHVLSWTNITIKSENVLSLMDQDEASGAEAQPSSSANAAASN